MDCIDQRVCGWLGEHNNIEYRNEDITWTQLNSTMLSSVFLKGALLSLHGEKAGFLVPLKENMETYFSGNILNCIMILMKSPNNGKDGVSTGHLLSSSKASTSRTGFQSINCWPVRVS